MKQLNAFLTTCLTLALLTAPFVLPEVLGSGVPGGGGSGGSPNPGGQQTVPVSGGVGFLVAAGVGYGVKKYYDWKNQDNDSAEEG